MKLTLILVSIIVAQITIGQQSYTLEEAQNYALANNPQAQLAQLEVDQAHLTVKEFKSIGLPQVNAEGTFQNFLNLPTNLIPAQFFNQNAGPNDFIGVRFGTDFNVTGSIGVNQLLFDGSYLTGLKASKLYPVLSEKQQLQVAMDIKASVQQAYYMAAIAERNIEFLNDMNSSNDELKNYLLILQQKGMMDSANIDQVDLSLKKLNAQMKKAELNLDLALKSLMLAMGMDINSSIQISDKLDDIVTNINLTTNTSTYGAEKDINMQLLQTNMDLQQLNLEVKKSAYLPSLGAFFSHQYQAQRNEFNFFADEQWFPTTIWGISLKIPIYSGGRRNAQVQQQEIEIKKVEAQMDIAKRGIEMQFAAAISEFQGAKAVYEAEEEAYVIAQKIKARTDILYNKKVASMLEVAQAQLQLESSHNNLIQAMYGFANAKVKLDKIINNQ